MKKVAQSRIMPNIMTMNQVAKKVLAVMKSTMKRNQAMMVMNKNNLRTSKYSNDQFNLIKVKFCKENKLNYLNNKQQLKSKIKVKAKINQNLDLRSRKIKAEQAMQAKKVSLMEKTESMSTMMKKKNMTKKKNKSQLR